MTLERIHFYIVSVVLRLIGVVFLYDAAQKIGSFIEFAFFGSWDTMAKIENGSLIVVQIALAAYFLLGAPPTLRWVRRFPPTP